MRMEFSDGGYIEENKSGLIYVGRIANECGHVMAKTKCDLPTFKKVFEANVETIKKSLMNK